MCIPLLLADRVIYLVIKVLIVSNIFLWSVKNMINCVYLRVMPHCRTTATEQNFVTCKTNYISKNEWTN